MFDSKKYHREYMREHRAKPSANTEEKLAKRREYARRYRQEVLLQRPEWIEANRIRSREYARKRRENPEYRKARYKDHTTWARKNKDYINAKQRERNRRPENKLKAKSRLIEKKYGIPYAQYEALIKSQHGKCPVCKVDLDVHGMMSATKAVVDHDHEGGTIRGILCSTCSLNLGFIENNQRLVKPMLKYLRDWKKRQGVVKQTA